MKKVVTAAAIAGIITITSPVVALAHVVVSPNQASTGDRVTFSVSVPNERDSNVTSLRLDIPKGVGDAMPNVMAGWDITTEKSGDEVTSITWTGVIPAGQRADFVFRAQAPAKTGDITWKAHQTYEDGTVVNWDQKPTDDHGDDESATSGPYSVTKITDDLAQPASTQVTTSDSTGTLALLLSGTAVIFSIVSLVWRRRA